jgi:hypothetical protein
VSQQVAVLVYRAALGRHVAPEGGQRLLQPGAAVDNQELWLAQPALDEIAATRRPHESEYFRFELYLNGNLHIVFKRPDLVAKANEIVADYYGETLADGRRAA